MSEDMPITFPLSLLAARTEFRTEFNAYVQNLACTYFLKKISQCDCLQQCSTARHGHREGE